MTAGLTSIYFAAGCRRRCSARRVRRTAAARFIVLSGVTLYFTRRQKYVNSRRLATNADRMIGAVVSSRKISIIWPVRRCRHRRQDLTARSVDGTPIAKGSTVRVCAIEASLMWRRQTVRLTRLTTQKMKPQQQHKQYKEKWRLSHARCQYVPVVLIVIGQLSSLSARNIKVVQQANAFVGSALAPHLGCGLHFRCRLLSASPRWCPSRSRSWTSA